tara:strand:+ start:2061 stop:2669 length:609 start_codon:yes stop_codon:yes gene_type:complete
MWLLAGLGNPGLSYAGHRHNVGFMAIDRIASDYNIGPARQKFHGQFSQGLIQNQKVLLLKPETYMNDSGRSVQAAASFYNIPEERICVIYDELDLPPGKVKLKQGGGSGGHNGIKSIDSHLPSKEYWRLRIGIGHPGSKDRVSPYVLSNFAKAEQPFFEDILSAVSKEIPNFLSETSDHKFKTALAERLKMVLPKEEKKESK